jgi:hypothetical protein
MRKLAKIAAGAGVILALAALGTVGFNHYRASQTPKLQVNLACKPRKELITRYHTDWLVTHVPGTNCQDADLQVVYNNGEVGNRHYRDNLTLESETIWTADGKERRHVVYDADGKTIVQASEDWLDGNPAWRYSVDAGKTFTSTRYWTDGMVFSRETGTVGGNKNEATYFYKNGARWAHFVGPLEGDSNNIVPRAVQLEVWSQGGSYLLQRIDNSGTYAFNVYRPDGTLFYVQTWDVQVWWSGNRLKTVDMYSADGKRLEKQVMMSWSGSYVDEIVEFAEDGSKKGYTIEGWSSKVLMVRSYDKDGHFISDEKVTDGSTMPVDKQLLTKPTFASPQDEWQKLVDKQIYNSAP